MHEFVYFFSYSASSKCAREKTLLSEPRDPVKGESGLTCKPDISIAEADATSIDSLLFPGCYGISTLREAHELFRFVKKVVRNDTKIFAISSSPFNLAKAGLLENKRYTVGLSKEDREWLGVFDEKYYTDELLVHDGNLVTARG
ncbi:DJ-1/PfpI family protein [Brevibacillus sp. SYP-B805]|uniref:DJ-1/PfpI family protein n=1 Tax=Brevibacillus sp. SYP-B805 TaxID=1578199 RepID=UPI0013EAD01F|nr:DJ-1/PfpI family protein [Brevibacillus sp. SYP-B805]NGQ94509.1 DJ-1/PfpI family protein [Brevibacillus sp. SYP-B805]